MHFWDVKTKIGAIFLLAVLPALFSHGALQAAVVLLCYGIALFLVHRVLRAHQGSLEKKYSDERERQTAAVQALLLPLTAHLNDNVQIMPVLTDQLKEVTRQTEQATLDMGEKFMEIAGRARGHAAHASEMFMRLGAAGGDASLVRVSRNTFAEVMTGLEAMTLVATESRKDMAIITNGAQSMKKVVGEIEYIAQQTDLLALHAASEAARAGESQKSFSVVADEARKLSDRSNIAADKIRMLIGKIEGDISSIHQKTEKSAAENEEKSRSAGRAVKEALARLDEMMKGAKDRLDELMRSNEELARDISGIITSMQFQDITQQRIEHVIELLMKSESKAGILLERLKSMNDVVYGWKHENRAAWLEMTDTMDAERAAVMKNTLLALNKKITSSGGARNDQEIPCRG